jgi:RNA polymerase sigma factor (sigma-70 family)
MPTDADAPASTNAPELAGDRLARLVNAAVEGDQAAWRSIVANYTPLVQSVVRRFRLSPTDAEDVSQMVWLRVLEHLSGLRQAQALPGWIATTTKREALRVIDSRQRVKPMDPSVMCMLHIADRSADVSDRLLRNERAEAIASGLATLQYRQRTLLQLVHTEPKVSYEVIGKQLDMPVGSIGPTRARCIEKVRQTPAVHQLLCVD